MVQRNSSLRSVSLAYERDDMAANGNREQQRAELHKAIWGIADDVRGAVDGWDFKSYILSFLFYRFISEDLAEYIDEGEREATGDDFFSYAKLSDEDAEMAREDVVKDKGFFRGFGSLCDKGLA